MIGVTNVSVNKIPKLRDFVKFATNCLNIKKQFQQKKRT